MFIKLHSNPGAIKCIDFNVFFNIGGDAERSKELHQLLISENIIKLDDLGYIDADITLAIYYMDSPDMLQFLIDHGLNVEAKCQDGGHSLIYYAAVVCSFRGYKFFQRLGLCALESNTKGESALTLMSRCHGIETIKDIIDYEMGDI